VSKQDSFGYYIHGIRNFNAISQDSAECGAYLASMLELFHHSRDDPFSSEQMGLTWALADRCAEEGGETD